MLQSGNTILITGGASGIGLAFAERFLEAGNQVIVCGRRAEKLEEAKAKFPALHTRVCDVANEQDRLELCDWLVREFPNLNALINNAGIQQWVNVLRADDDWAHFHQEIAINFDAPIHLTLRLLPHLVKQPHGAIVNVSSGLALAPATWAPIYSATKAALHSFTQSLRLQLEGTNVDVIEILPPAVNTDLGGPGLHTFGAPLNEFVDGVFASLERGEIEIGYGDSERRLHASREELAEAAQQMWMGFRKRNPEF
ncbi:putative oxidoreductase [Alicyclobacillus sacchari]|uniref:Putative oxidoreductase n=1 Tax=Alicyclobacillus sacchari TaxID=392010 RepID=A0A4R8LHZ9_9BACL|nr:SDR family NAD(P)-dependent oxidoreductase [Alicyclobacillus sacchari]TDY42417.1 putative oxidoreductase [Alicyclobacillus sacchari]GMA57362.1 short-chain dehydrogenase [Alicyclobacillus sacchari]